MTRAVDDAPGVARIEERRMIPAVDDAERSDEVEARPLAAVRVGVPPPGCGGERRA
jgi:hypothetical protein